MGHRVRKKHNQESADGEQVGALEDVAKSINAASEWAVMAETAFALHNHTRPPNESRTRLEHIKRACDFVE